MMHGDVVNVDTDTGIALTASPGRPSSANGGDDVGLKELPQLTEVAA